MQANFWELLNNTNFGFDYRDNSQNKSLHLIHDENAEVEFISKYSSYDSDSCFLNLHARIKYYDDVDNLEKDEVPYADSLREEEIERVIDRYRKRKKVGKVRTRSLATRGTSKGPTLTRPTLLFKILKKKASTVLRVWFVRNKPR